MKKIKKVYTGDIFIIDFSLNSKRSEIKKSRPGVVFQNDEVTNQVKTVIVLPFTSNLKRKGLPYALFIPKSKENGLEKDSIILCHQIRAVDKTRLNKKIGRLNDKQISELELKLLYTLGIS